MPAKVLAPATAHAAPAESGQRHAIPPEPIRVQRRASVIDVIVVARQKIALGHSHAGHVATVLVADTTPAIEFTDGHTRVIRHITTQPMRSIKGQRARTATSIS